MKPIRLKMRGIGPYAGEVDIDFSSLNENGLFLITGPTGAGKTSIFDGITYALYGKTNLKDPEKLNGIISDYIDENEHKDAYVEFCFELDNIDYRVKRMPKYNYINRNGKESVKGESLEVEFRDKILNNKVEADNYIEKDIIKLNYDQFKKIMMLAQGSFNEFIKSDSKDKSIILEQIFETSIYSEFEKKLKEKRDNLNKNLEKSRNEIKGKLSSLNISHENWNKTLEKSTLDYENIETILDIEIKTNEEITEKLTEEKKKLEKKLEFLREEIIKANGINQNIEKFYDAEKNLKILLESSEEIAELEASKKRAEDALKIKSTVDSYEKICKSEELAKEEYKIDSTELDNLKNSNQEDISNIENYRDEHKKIEIKISNFEKLESEKCFYDKVLKEITNLKEIVELIKKEEAELKNEVLNLEKNLEELSAEREEIRKKLELKKEIEDKISIMKEENTRLDILIDILNKKEETARNIGDLTEKLKKQEQGALEALNIYSNLQNVWFQSEAYKLSSKLENGKPCPVCGSEEHPLPAEKPENVPSQKELDAAKERYERENSEKERVHGSKEQLEKEVERLQKSFESYCTEMEILPEEQLIRENKELLSQELKDYQKEIKKLPVQKDLNILEEEIKLCMEKRGSSRENLTSSEGKINVEEANIKNLRKEIERIEKAFEKEKVDIIDFENIKKLEEKNEIELKNKISTIEDIISTITEKSARLKKSKEDLDRLKSDKVEEEKNFNYALSENSFESLEAYHKALEINREIIEENLKLYSESKAKYQGLKEEYAEWESKEKIETSELEESIKETSENNQSKERDIREIGIKTDPIKRFKLELKTIRESQETSEKEFERLDKLHLISQGKFGNLRNNVSFQNYVLGVYFQEVLDRANIRFISMTNKQYRMEIDSTKKGNRESGLELNVYDNHTGKVRSIKTLSGGETFKASMSLALGLSDVVQEQNGGIKLDSVFIDEGFGTLDDESLSSAIDILVAIQNSGRTVGIISHVNELKQLIPSQIIVEKDERGSKVKVVG